MTDSNQNHSHKSKKVKIQNARQIFTQSPYQLIRSSTIHAQSSLPEFLDVEKFINSRSFEISAMERSMKSSRESGSQRAFQSLPRHLRRRSASHFSRRLPTRLRMKSKFEMMNDKPKSKSRSIKNKIKHKVYLKINKTKVFRNRQIDKKWLSTHLWHSKRTKMIDLWGYRLAETPTEKCYRTTYRASRSGSTIHDLSYFSNLTLVSDEVSLIQLFHSISDPFGLDPSSIKYKPGHREINLDVYEFEKYPYGYIGPISMIWCPISNPIDENEELLPPPAAQEVPKLNNRSRFKSKSNFQDLDEDRLFESDHPIILPSDPMTINTINPIPSMDLSSSLESLHHSKEHISTSQDTKDSNLLENPCNRTIPPIQRKVLLQIHPAIKDQVIECIHQANRNSKVVLECQEDLGCLELFGPRSTEVLGRVLETDEKVEVMKLLKNGLRPNLFPLGMVIGLTIDDPRVHFPPRKMKVMEEKNEMIHDLKVMEPSVEIAKCLGFWNQEIRLKKPKFKKSHLDKRREEQMIPGSRLKPLIEDDRIPILLIKVKLGWKLMISNHWIQSIFQSILFTNVRLICLNQRSQILFEDQSPRFPEDFNTLKPFEELKLMDSLKEKTVWSRKPPGKRINLYRFEDREMDYFFINWDLVFGNDEDQKEEEIEEDLFIPTDHLKLRKIKTPWLLNGLIVSTFLKSLKSLIDLNVQLKLNYEDLMENGWKLFKKICIEINRNGNELNPLELSLVKVKMVLLSDENQRIHGNRNQKMEKFCRIYRFDERFMNQRKVEEVNGIGKMKDTMKKEMKLIGFLNDGKFSLRLGNCLGFGSVSFFEFIKIKLKDLLNENEEEKNRFKMNEIKVGFRNRDEFEIKVGKLIVIDA
ncbi:uncharacterized protein MELLADRAFT_116208 [Melampsora larici-populina 98AG31]|uniref:Uncharacterized protein n=1 Tax=Melampsora larici-populina (strain 98AG31 / pathotype 3-4-7) TaxID=747676 RepID=F4RIV8_MELLP|nr:uncharacterized protein MELLADRAFT_116208 [Melampsora larici-populina 98AG31]EGG07630.1 hypothetical protein MELLADRAFT_116208 [Melampsora larici-populina 98AG31]